MRFLHTMIRVKDLERAKEFYRTLGMEQVRETEYPSGRFTLAFFRFPGDSAEVELTYNWDPETYVVGRAWGHLAFGVPDIKRTVEDLRAKGVKITREPGPMKHGATVIAFLEDPDGRVVELIERPSSSAKGLAGT